MLAVALVLLTALVVTSTLGLVQNAKISRRLESYQDGITTFFTAETEGQGTAFNQVVNQICDVIATKQAVSTQAAIRGALGGSQKAINHELEQVAIAENPELGMLDALPKSLRKNPIAMMGLQALMNKQFSGAGGSPAGHSPSRQNGRAKFNL